MDFIPTVDLSINTIIRECSLDPNEARSHYNYFSLVNRENIHQVMKYRKFRDDFIDKLTCYNTKDGEYTIGTVRPSYNLFLSKLLKQLNIKETSKLKDDDSLTKLLNDKVKELESITSEEELRLKFPLIYNDLVNGRRFIKEVEAQRDFSDDPKVLEECANKEDYYYRCGLQRSLKNFIPKQKLLYTRFINQRNELKQLQEKKSYNAYISKHFNMDKIYMYTIHEYLKKCEASNDKEEINYYVSLIEKYLNSDKNKNVSLTTDENIRVDITSIMQRLTNIKRRIDDNSSLVEWILIPEGKDYSRVKKDQNHEERVTIFNFEELEKLKRIGEKRRTFYETSKYLAKAVGLRRYKGYVAYIYENGKVILDRELNEDHPKELEDNAAYIIKAKDFIELSKQDKPTLMHNKNVRRKYHTPTFEHRIEKEMLSEGTEQEQQDSQELIKTLRSR